MSERHLFRWRDAVCSEDGPPATTRHVLVILSLDANEDGGSCYPSTRRLSTRTGLSRTCVMKHLEAAEQDGWIRRRAMGTDRGQGWKRFVYDLSIPEKVVNDDDHDTGKVVNESDHVGGQQGSPPSDERGQPQDEGGQPERGKVVNEVDHTSPVTSPQTSPTPPEGEADASTPESDQDERMGANEVLAEWINLRGERPPPADVAKQSAAAKRLAGKYTRTDVTKALDGIGRLFPHSNGEPWDLMDLERKFVKALVAPTTNGTGRGYQDPARDIDYAAEAAKHQGGRS